MSIYRETPPVTTRVSVELLGRIRDALHRVAAMSAVPRDNGGSWWDEVYELRGRLAQIIDDAKQVLP